jgi:hypothetical protein
LLKTRHKIQHDISIHILQWVDNDFQIESKYHLFISNFVSCFSNIMTWDIVFVEFVSYISGNCLLPKCCMVSILTYAALINIFRLAIMIYKFYHISVTSLWTPKIKSHVLYGYVPGQRNFIVTLEYCEAKFSSSCYSNRNYILYLYIFL